MFCGYATFYSHLKVVSILLIGSLMVLKGRFKSVAMAMSAAFHSVMPLLLPHRNRRESRPDHFPSLRYACVCSLLPPRHPVPLPFLHTQVIVHVRIYIQMCMFIGM